jgi:hypothetical protein
VVLNLVSCFSVAKLPVWLVFHRQTNEMEEMTESFCKNRERKFKSVSGYEELYSAEKQC